MSPVDDSWQSAPLDAIARPSGALGMVAIDQRESLRTMLEQHHPSPVSDRDVERFKVAVARALAPHASAMLFDSRFGMPAMAEARAVAPSCGLIVAADRLTQIPGQIVTDTDIDEDVDPRAVRAAGGVALKLLVLWKHHGDGDRLLAMADRFMETCRANGLIGIVEAMVRRPEDDTGAAWGREEAIVDAAACLGESRPDLYKCDVPFLGKAAPSDIEAWARRVTASLRCPWVVLSQGVAIEDFPTAVAAACRGGASGFLAGRAIWADTLAGDYAERLATVSVKRLQHLGAIVDQEARPWHEARAASA